MGEETTQFASRFATAVSALAQLATDDGHAALARRHGAKLAGAVRDALDAVAAVHETGTQAIENWPAQRARVLAQIGSIRDALDRRGVDDGVRRMAGALVDLIAPGEGR